MNYQGEGVGADIEIDGVMYNIYAGNKKLFDREHISLDFNTESEIVTYSEEGKTVIIVCINRKPVGTVSLRDVSLVREESKDTVAHLQSKGYKVWMITGDNEMCAKAVSDAVGIKHFAAS